jgi:DNA-binding response OmpR family regulator
MVVGKGKGEYGEHCRGSPCIYIETRRLVEETTEGSVKVLVIDDDPDLIKLITEIMKLKGFNVLGALSGEEGVRLAKSEAPDAILLDVAIPPGITGSEVCKMLRLDPETKNIPVIFLTAWVDVDAMELCVEEEAQDYVLKPFLPSVLVSKIDEVLRRNV